MGTSTATRVRARRNRRPVKAEQFFQVVEVKHDGTRRIISPCICKAGAEACVWTSYSLSRRQLPTERSQYVAEELLPIFNVRPGGKVIDRKAAKRAEKRSNQHLADMIADVRSR